MLSSFFSVAPKDEASVSKQQKLALDELRQKIGSTKVEEQLRQGGEPGGRHEVINTLSTFSGFGPRSQRNSYRPGRPANVANMDASDLSGICVHSSSILSLEVFVIVFEWFTALITDGRLVLPF